jgi:gluconolactonase
LIGGIKFQIPADWEEGNANAAIIAEYRLPGGAGAARLTLSTAGGGTEANIERWKQQFHRGSSDPEPKESRITAAGKPGTLIELHGSFSDMFAGGGSKPNWQLLGVAIPIDSDHNYFVKLTGPQKTVAARQEEFLNFVETARFE